LHRGVFLSVTATLENQDDKWCVYVSAPEQFIFIHIARNAVGIVLYIVLKPDDDGSSGNSTEIASIIWEANQGGIHISEEQAKNEVVIIIKGILEYDLDALLEHYVKDIWNHSVADISAHIYAHLAPKAQLPGKGSH